VYGEGAYGASLNYLEPGVEAARKGHAQAYVQTRAEDAAQLREENKDLRARLLATTAREAKVQPQARVTAHFTPLYLWGVVCICMYAGIPTIFSFIFPILAEGRSGPNTICGGTQTVFGL
jgi:hypothetical protein